MLYSNKEKFIEKAKKIHNNKYDYSLTEYINSKTKIKIICSEHGIFEQQPNHHISGHGCKYCGYINTINKQSLNKEKFIKKAIKIHNNKYDYSLVEYINSKTKVKIICSEHGVFEQRPSFHIHKKQGCPKCCKSGILLTINEFIKKSKIIHNNKYDYSLVKYKNAQTKVEIICLKHGIFTQRPALHMYQQQGCPICKSSKGELKIVNILKNNNIKFKRQKIFIRCKNKSYLPFDFYLPLYNICIEYDGEQHFRAINIWGGEKGLKYIQSNDQIKTQYCNDNNILFLRIKYNQNIESVLKAYLVGKGIINVGKPNR